MIVMSDHGTNKSLWESEIINHGNPVHGNESFVYFGNKKLNRNKVEAEYISSYEFPVIMANYISDLNVAMNAN